MERDFITFSSASPDSYPLFMHQAKSGETCDSLVSEWKHSSADGAVGGAGQRHDIQMKYAREREKVK